MWSNIILQRFYFRTHVREWKKEFILQQTLYQIEMQKNLKDKVVLPERAQSLVDENFAEEEIIAEAQKILEMEQKEMVRKQKEEEERTREIQ